MSDGYTPEPGSRLGWRVGGSSTTVEIGSKAWADSAERAEWAFMAKMLQEAREHLPLILSGVGVAIDIAKARSKSGWRSFATPEDAEAKRLKDEHRDMLPLVAEMACRTKGPEDMEGGCCAPCRARAALKGAAIQ